MAKQKVKTSKSSFKDDDLLDSLFDDKKQPVRMKEPRGRDLNRSSATDNIFSLLAEELKRDGVDSENSDVSAADPSDILKDMKDLDDMEVELFSLKKKTLGSAPAQTKPSPSEGPKKDSTVLESSVKPEGEDEPSAGGKRPDSAPSSTTRNYKKFTFSDDLDDPLADLLDDLLPDETKPESKSNQTKPEKSAPSPSASPALKTETTKAAKKSDFTFDEKDDLMDALGFDGDGSSAKKKGTPLWSAKERSDAPQRTRTRIDEILESFTSPGVRDNQLQSEEKRQHEKTSVGKESLLEDDLTFGSYQPTLVSTPEGRQSRRQSVRFSTEDVSASTPEKKPKATSNRHRSSADWLGLKANDDLNYLDDDPKEVKSPKLPSSPLLERKNSVTSVTKTAAEAPASTNNNNNNVSSQSKEIQKKKEEEDDDWLAGALSRKKAITSKQEDSLFLGEEVDLESSVTRQAASQRGKEDTLLSLKETSDTFLGRPSPAAHSTPVREEMPKQDPPAQPADPSPAPAASISHPQRPPSGHGSRTLKESSQASGETLQPPAGSLPSVLPGTSWLSQQNQIQNTSTAVQQQATFPADFLQQLLLQQQLMQTQLLGLGGGADAGVMQRLPDKQQQPGDCQALQARIIQLEGQVKTLQLERDQSQMVLENIQQQHKHTVELMENTHKARVKLLEDSSTQRETQMQRECEDLMERLATVTRSAEHERSELQAQYQRKLAQAQQDRDREVERLRDLQRKSILEMKKDHEDQVQRLKKLKNEEIDAVTSATSQTRSLAGMIEQMEQFSSRLGELSSRVESTHEHTAQGLEKGARHRDEQLRTMQDRLAQQQRAMAEERAYLKEIISRMDTQLNEQQRQLEKERWKVTAEQAKAESTQRGLEEERRVQTLQLSMEREELERAKSALLEEQKSVMQLCADERRKLAAEWAQFHTQEKQRRERSERDVSSLLEKREGSILSLAQDQADMKLRMAELKQKETSVSQERETLERLREELDREKEKLSSTALRLKTRAQEVEAFSKLAADKFEEGERALLEAKRVEAQHEARLRNIHSQTEQLRQQEQRVLKERMQLNLVQKDTEMRPSVSITPLPPVIPTLLPDSVSVLPEPELTTTLNLLPPPPSLSNNRSMALQASLALWKYTAEKDREFLQEEQIFLENLKKKPYRSSFTTD
ncbi:fas-binding factor 1-like isoform X2 [Mugil cephalus]|uniref:fas-binding factor 1-like isoform X2 n=1 Tax=Mugil cephalus TaxID=48193 RepID=UPI001FB58608|nr:fas-binding factor 1-like isoform X2 [Mugil cephalus]